MKNKMLVQGTVSMTGFSQQQSQAGVPTATPCTILFRGPPEATAPERAGLPAAAAAAAAVTTRSLARHGLRCSGFASCFIAVRPRNYPRQCGTRPAPELQSGRPSAWGSGSAWWNLCQSQNQVRNQNQNQNQTPGQRAAHPLRYSSMLSATSGAKP